MVSSKITNVRDGEQPKICYLKKPHVPKHMKPLKRYIDSNEYKRKEDDKFFKNLIEIDIKFMKIKIRVIRLQSLIV